MRAFKIAGILLGFLLIQLAYGKPLDDTDNSREIQETVTPEKMLSLYVGANYLLIVHKYSGKCANYSRQLLKDESLLANDKPGVLEFKEKLSQFVQHFETNKNPQKYIQIFGMFSDATDYYFELTGEERTADVLFILDVLNKYKFKELEEQFIKEFDMFVEEFKLLFEEYKLVVEKPLQDWYEKFLTLNDFDARFDAFEEFAELQIV